MDVATKERAVLDVHIFGFKPQHDKLKLGCLQLIIRIFQIYNIVR